MYPKFINGLMKDINESQMSHLLYIKPTFLLKVLIFVVSLSFRPVKEGYAAFIGHAVFIRRDKRIIFCEEKKKIRDCKSDMQLKGTSIN